MKTYKTTDIYVSAFLQEQGFRIIDAERSNEKVTLIFEDAQDRAQDAVRLYFNGATVAAVRFADRLRHLKTLVMRGWGV